MGVETERAKGFGRFDAISSVGAGRAHGIAARPSTGGERSEETDSRVAGGIVLVRTRKVVVVREIALC